MLYDTRSTCWATGSFLSYVAFLVCGFPVIAGNPGTLQETEEDVEVIIGTRGGFVHKKESKKGGPITGVFFVSQRIGEDGLRIVAELSELESLCLMGSTLSNGSLWPIKMLPLLRDLNLLPFPTTAPAMDGRDAMSELVFREGFWVRADNVEQDLVVVRDIVRDDAYRTAPRS